MDLGSHSRLRKLRKVEDVSTVVNNTELESRLRSQFEKIHPRPSWASVKVNSDAFVIKPFDLIQKISKELPKNNIDINRLVDANISEPSNCVISSLQFSPKSSDLLMNSGLDRKIRLFDVSSSPDSPPKKVKGFFLEDLPVIQSAFSADGNQLFASGRRSYFYRIDLNSLSVLRNETFIRGGASLVDSPPKSLERFCVSPDGKWIVFTGSLGRLFVVCAKSGCLVNTLKGTGEPIKDVCFNNDSRLFSVGADREILEWDIKNRKCLSTLLDDGGVKGTALAVSSANLLACGSDSGIVNLYQNNSEERYALAKSIENLSTEVTSLKFHPSGSVLAAASRSIKDSLKLIHTSSGTVFKNWPNSKTPLSYVNAIDFSNDGRKLAVGNDKGKVLLYKLNHF